MSRSCTNDEKEKFHALHGRQDQIHPSDRPPAIRLQLSHPVDPHEVSAVEGYILGFRLQDTKIWCWKEKNGSDMWVYIWSDGVKFEGEVNTATVSGKGKFSWPTGATYEGTFLNTCLHGKGTYIGIDGSRYTGNWVMNLKHGSGVQKYANGDVYTGAWCQGKREGHGRYIWANGNIYSGNWKGNAMCGNGRLTWSNGDLFEGLWSDGKEHGYGVYTWMDGGCYVGTWSRGHKDGKGTFYPPGTEPPMHSRLYNGLVSGKHATHVPTSLQYSLRLWHSTADIGKIVPWIHSSRQQMTSRNSLKFLTKALSFPAKAIRPKVESGLRKMSDSLQQSQAEENVAGKEMKATLPVVDREYAQGVLINEIIKEPLLCKHSWHQRKSQSTKSEMPGEKIIKGHRSYDLMLDLQLGIRYSVEKFNRIEHPLQNKDFCSRAKIWMRFPKKRSNDTLPHHFVNFKWKDYCPLVFRMLRDMFKINAADYQMSICGKDGLRELSSPGKSGSIFFLSHDDRFLIKTLKKQELKILLKMLPKYYSHVCKYENTLITKFFGLHSIKLEGGHNVRFVVMGNVFCSELRIHRRFDLKGSSLGRSANKLEIDETTILKDLDLDFTFHLEPSWRSSLLKQIEEDCRFLESQQIMDYSLLLGLHFRAPEYRGKQADTQQMRELHDGMYPRGLVLIAHEPTDSSQSLHSRGDPLRAAAAGDGQVDLLAGTARVRIQLGVNMPARAHREATNDRATSDDESASEVYDVVLCLGIIDILQEYNAMKKIEHAYKSMKFDSISISAVDPHQYSNRFQEFMKKTFPKDVF